MIRYPWNLLLDAILKNGGVEIHIHGLEGLNAKEIFELPSVSILREVRQQINNPDLSDQEKVALIQTLLE